ncbi:hypothetical protein PspCFBP13508_15965 [Pseudomonas sp. CFBP13508]|nr:hypothetical protein PspCFBP13508_15965 [Pseudomonas sp. CFBP13508]
MAASAHAIFVFIFRNIFRNYIYGNVFKLTIVRAISSSNHDTFKSYCFTRTKLYRDHKPGLRFL